MSQPDETPVAEDGEEVDFDRSEDTGKDEDKLRRSQREVKPTEKMAEYMKAEFAKQENRLELAYNEWRLIVRELRNFMRTDCDHSKLAEMSDRMKTLENRVVARFDDVRNKGTILPLITRKVDACTAVTHDLEKLVNERLSELEEFDSQQELCRLKALRNHEYAKSIFSAWEGESVCSHKSVLSEKVAEAAATLAQKQISYELLQEEESKHAKLTEFKMAQERALEAQLKEVKRFEALKEIKLAQAKLNAYEQTLNAEMGKKAYQIPTTAAQAKESQTENYEIRQKAVNSVKGDASASVIAPEEQTKVAEEETTNLWEREAFAKALADSVNLNRLPVPEPNVFCGDPLQYIEWKTSFETLIEHKGIPAKERIFYLKRYTGGAARKALEGFFFNSSESAYVSAQKVLEERYGHPFVLQKAFRDKLDKWPKIAAKDPMGLRDFADFLRGCRDALPHVPSLGILDDCGENQKLLVKLPDWASVRWNREVTQALETKNQYPTFSKFVDFVAREAKVACNPISSLYALNITDRKPLKETRAAGSNSKVSVLATGTSDTSKTKPQTKKCDYCSKMGHLIYKCDNFLSLTIERKRAFVQSNNLCYGCLRKGHINQDCKRKHTCYTCKGKHPTCMHEDRPPPQSQEEQPRNREMSASVLRVSQNGQQSTSMIVPVWVSHANDPSREILTYALLDTQSDTTFILEDTAEALCVPSQPIKLSLSTMTAQHTIIDSSRVCGLQVRGFQSSVNDAVSINQAYTRNFIPADRKHIPDKSTVKDWPHLQQILDDLPSPQSCDVGLLIGYNCPLALAPRKLLIGNADEPYAVQTVLGWSVVGYVNPTPDSTNASGICHRTAVHIKELPPCSPRDVIKVLERDFAEDKGYDKKVSQEDILFLSHLDGTITQRNDKHLEMPLPFKERPVLPNNKPLALLHLNHLKRKLKNDQRLYEQYKQYMTDMIDRGDAEVVSTKAVQGNEWYIPHHGVYHSKKPDKLRVVFDCSARYKDQSLNQHLLTGPDLTNGLAGVLCRFRQHQIAVMCDIEKMFHQFTVSEPNRDFLKFLWWENGDLDRPPLEYRMRVHLFGAASSPGCANYGLKYLAKTYEEQYPTASSFIQNDFYVDDGLTSTATDEEAVQLVRDAQQVCTNGGLRLHKFISNSKKVIESIPVSERASDVKDLDLTLEELPVERALGVIWNIEQDVFGFHVTIKDPVATRRNMLSIVASIFDPLGFLSPFTLKEKRILQEMCRNGVVWDDPSPKCLQPDWENWIKDVPNLQSVKISRPLKPSDFGRPLQIELHHFSDASSTGYGQCTYVRFVGEDRVHCSLVMAKARVAPQKVVTIPRLELTAAVLSVKMSMYLKEEFNFTIDKEYFWTDSRVVLGYISNEARRFHVFVANRVQIIRVVTEPEQWFYVSSEDNPADHASRGLSASGVATSNWLKGPSFLWKRVIKTEDVAAELQLGDPEIRSARTFCTKTTEGPGILERLERFSSWTKVVTVIARLQRLSNGVKGTHSPTVKERQNAERTILKYVQQDAFKECIDRLKTSEALPKTNSLYPLDPSLKEGLLCVGGRLRKASLSLQHRHPIILPKDSHITQLILAHAHEQTKHQGRGMTLNRLCSCGYWIVGGSKTVAKFIRGCVTCRKLRPPTETQRMADFPPERVWPSPPFTYCGMDCFGPFIIKQG